MRIIAHIDMDAFFAAVEERDTPRFKGKPIVVGADPKEGRGRGVVSTASYAARKYGIHSAMPISKAWQLAKAAEARGELPTIFLPGSYKKYSAVSVRIRQTIQGATPGVAPMEQASIDEFYLDLSTLGSYPKAEKRVRRIKEEIKDKEQLTCSVGIAPNKLVAKIASDQHKPNGLTTVKPNEVLDFLSPLPIRVIPGVGPKTEAVLQKLGVETVADARKFSESKLVQKFGKWGSSLYRKARGISDSPVTEEHEVKSIGEQETFEKDTLESNFLVERLNAMCESVFKNLKQDGFESFRTIALIVRFADFTTLSRAHTLKTPVAEVRTLKREALKLLIPFFDKRENPRRKKTRLIGVRVEKLK